MAKYLFAIGDYTASPWAQKGLAIGCYTIALAFVLFHTKTSYLLSNAIEMVKLITLIFISITGLVVLGGHTAVERPRADFQNAFEGEASAYGVTNAMYKTIFAYAGYENAFNVVNEVKVSRNRDCLSINQLTCHRIQSRAFATMASALSCSLPSCTSYAMSRSSQPVSQPALDPDQFLTSSAVTKDEILEGREIAASLLFTKVFGNHGAVRGLNFLIALSSFGNLIAVLLGTSRMIRECGRQGVLPWPKFWASTKPFGTPAGPYFIKWFLTIVIILAVPAGDAFSFITDLQVYPSSVFSLLMGIGIHILRHNRKRLGLPRPSFKAWNVVLIFNIAVQLYLIIMPWYTPTEGATGGDVSFWYATYVVTGIGILLICGAYYVGYIVVLPRVKNYKLRQELIELGDGAQTHVLRKIAVSQVEEWDRLHDANGHRLVPEWSSQEHAADVTVLAESKNG